MGKDHPADWSDRAHLQKTLRDARKKKKPLTYEEFEEVFALYDRDNNGKLQYSEMNAFMKDLLLRIGKTKKASIPGDLSEKEIHKFAEDATKLVKKYDEDRSGTFDKKEVAKLLNVKIPLKDSYTLPTSVRSKSKLFEGNKVPSSDTQSNSPESVEDEEEDEGEIVELESVPDIPPKQEEVSPADNGTGNWQAVQKRSFSEWVRVDHVTRHSHSPMEKKPPSIPLI